METLIAGGTVEKNIDEQIVFEQLKTNKDAVWSLLLASGYLRVGDPTGEKVEISKENPATYNFADDMRRVLWGVELGADWKITRRFTAFANLDWGMNSVFKSDFKTIDFPMYPLYATFGIAYLY